MADMKCELLTKCLEFTRQMVVDDVMFQINLKIGHDDENFEFNFSNLQKKKPSQIKRDIERRKEFTRKKVKSENIEKDKFLEDKLVEIKTEVKKIKSKKIKLRVASHMGSAAETVVKSAVRKHFSYSMSEKVRWNKNESQWDIREKVDGIFSGIHEFEFVIDDNNAVDEKITLMSKNWEKGQFPTKLLRIWTEDV